MPPIGFFVSLTVVVIIGAISLRHDRQRRKLLLVWATGRGWKYNHQGVRSLSSKYPGLNILGKGHSRGNKNVIRGEVDGRPVLCLDYKYETGSGKNRSTHNYGMVILECGFPTIPMLIRREHVFDRVGEFLGVDDIDFESAEFSRKFYVKANDRKWAYDIIHSGTMDYLLQAPKCTIEFGTGEIVVYNSGDNSPQEHEEALGVAREMLKLIPEYVLNQMKGGS